MIKAIVFDLDDTLYPEKKYVISGFKNVARYISEKCSVEDQLVKESLITLHQAKREKVFDRLLEDGRFSSVSVRELIDIYRNHIPSIELFSDVAQVIGTLKSLGYKLGLITDGYKITQRNKILSLDIEKYFDAIIVTDELGREYWKPNPKAFEIIKENLQIDFNQMVYVGDNPKKDFYIGHIYPIKTIRINWGGYYNDQNYYKGIKEDLTITRLLDLQDVIDNLNLTEGESDE